MILFDVLAATTFGKLVFCRGEGIRNLCSAGAEMYSQDELLCVSVEMVGHGEVGSTYKAVMETSFIVTREGTYLLAALPGGLLACLINFIHAIECYP